MTFRNIQDKEKQFISEGVSQICTLTNQQAEHLCAKFVTLSIATVVILFLVVNSSFFFFPLKLSDELNTVSPKRKKSPIPAFSPSSFLSSAHSLALFPSSFDPHPTHVAALAGLFFRARAVRFCIRWLSTPSVLMGFRQCHLTQAHSGFWDCLSWLSWRSIGHYSSVFTHLLSAFIQSFCAANLPV